MDEILGAGLLCSQMFEEWEEGVSLDNSLERGK
jgi:hypothetical protein